MKNLLIILSILTLATACTEDIDLNAKNTVGVLCANGFIYTDSDINFIFVTETGMERATKINDARVELSVNGETKEIVTSADTVAGRYPITTILRDGDKVRFDIYHGNKHAYSEGVMPTKISDFGIDYTIEKDRPYHEYYDEKPYYADMFRFNLNFNDISADKNYYRLYTETNCSKTYQYTYTIYDRDSTVTTQQTDVISAKLNYEGELLLTDEAFKVETEMMDGIDNECHVFKNARFAGGKCNMKYYKIAGLDYSYKDDQYKPSVIIPETEEFHEEDSSDLNHTRYYYAETIGIESINEDAYYYYKAVNNYRAGTFDNQEITGSVKMHTNVIGGSGNIVLTSRLLKTIVIYDSITPKPVYVPWGDYPIYY
ncbi:MAG: DUF4249 family protein [Bacteroidales bacterium]|nr:DUF4249 family protein [Bacteroidales bacterium]